MMFLRLITLLRLTAVPLLLAPVLAQASQVRDDDDDRPALPVAIRRNQTVPVKTPTPTPTALRNGDDDDDKLAVPTSEIVVTARRLDAARAAVEPSLGASSYLLTNDAVENQPGGETTTLDQVLRQAPGVTLSGNGPLRVRAQGDLQYRINNIIVPDGLSDLGESLSPRLVVRIQLVAGALPAQYGLHAGGVVNLTTKSGVFDRGGQAELYGGSQSEIEPAFEYGGAVGRTNVFVSGSYRHNAAGLAAPDREAVPTHDRTDQLEGFGYLDRIIDDRTRVSLIVGSTNERFELPTLAGAPSPAGAQQQNSDYALASVLHTSGALTLQASVFARYARLNSINDRIAPTVLQSANTTSVTGGVQIDSAYVANAHHTLRAGTVLGADGGQSWTTLGASRTRLTDRRTIATGYVQDEWRPLAALVVNAGVRFDHVDGVGGGDRLSPRLNLVWSSGDVVVHLGYARYFVPAPQGETAAGDLLPETDDYYDIGIERTRGRLTLGIDTYVRRVTNMLADAPLGIGSRRQSYNFARGRSQGVEITMTFASGGFAAWSTLGVARTEGRDIISDQTLFPTAYLANVAGRYVRLDQDQTVTASGGASYRFGRLRLSSDMVYGSGTRATRPGGAVNAATLPSHLEASAAGVLHLVGLGGKPVDLRLDLINAFDNRYQSNDGTALGGGTAQFARARSLFIGIEQGF